MILEKKKEKYNTNYVYCICICIYIYYIITVHTFVKVIIINNEKINSVLQTFILLQNLIFLLIFYTKCTIKSTKCQKL